MEDDYLVLEYGDLKAWHWTLLKIIAVALKCIKFLLTWPWLVITLSWHGLCRLQDRLSDMRRRLKYGRTNSRNRAACLPAELQLQVFALLRSRAAFGSSERLTDAAPRYDRAAELGGCSNVAAARLVCRAWANAATEALYAAVTLPSALACAAFSRTLKAHPTRAGLVRRIVFPLEFRLLPNATPGQFYRSEALNLGVPKTEVKAIVDFLAGRCTRATDVSFSRTAGDGTLERVPGVVHCAPRIEQLVVRYRDPQRNRPRPAFSADELVLFPRLQSLTLQCHRLAAAAATIPAAALHTLRLAQCSTTLAALQALLGQLPALRVLALRDIDVLDHTLPVPVAHLFAPAQAVLTDGTLIGRERFAVPRSLDFFAALRRLTLSACLLAELPMLPPLLRELIVTTAPTPTLGVLAVRGGRKALFDLARCVLRLPTWTAPSLASVQLWDTVELSDIPDCYVFAYMLREALRPRGISVAVNLFLDDFSESDLRIQFQLRYIERRLRWQDVI